MSHSRILSTGSYLPGQPLTNEDLEAIIGPLPAEVLEGLEVKRRHWIADPATGEQRENNSDLACKAVKQALDLAGLDATQLDLLVVATASRDYLLPPMVTLVQEKLGLERCATLEVHSGAAGAVQALDVARLYLEHGAYQTAAVVASETISPLLVPVFLNRDPHSLRMRDRIPLYEYGDGAAAVILQAVEEEEPGILGSAMASVGGGRKPGIQIVGAGTHAPIHEQLKAPRLVDLRVDVVGIGKFSPQVLSVAVSDVLGRSGVPAESIDLFILPEGEAGYITQQLREAGLLTSDWTTLESRICQNLALVGCTGAASALLALDYAWKTGRLKPGARVLLIANETSKWIYAGIVLRWSAAPCRLDTGREGF